MNVSFADITMPKSGALAVFVAEGKTLTGTAADIDKKLDGALKRAIKAAGFKGAKGRFIELLAPKGLSVARVIVMGLGTASKLDTGAYETVGGTLTGHLDKTADKVVAVALDEVKGSSVSPEEAAAHLAFGARLRSYSFDKYRTKTKPDTKKKLTKMVVMSAEIGRAHV